MSRFAHRNAGVLELIQPRRVQRIGAVRARVHQHPDRHAGLVPLDQLGGIAGVLHEPERHVDADGLVPDVVDQDGAAVLVARIAEAILGLARGGGDEQQPHRQHQRPTEQPVESTRPRSIHSVPQESYCDRDATASSTDVLRGDEWDRRIVPDSMKWDGRGDVATHGLSAGCIRLGSVSRIRSVG